MNIFWKYIFPAFFGLVVYSSIRLVTDITSGEAFWKRSWKQNAIEVISVILMAYVFEAILRYAIRVFNKRKRGFSLVAVLQEFGALFLVCMLFINPALFIIHYLINDPVDWADVAIANVIVLLYVLLYYAIARGNTLIRSYVEQQTQIARLTSEGLQNELKFLKAQYHPHFLFNALNTIYFQMDENIPGAKQTIEKFSELLRYQLYDQQHLVSLYQELQHLQNFIHLQSVRASDKLQLQLAIDERLGNEKVYPLLFLPLVENAFKYVGGDYRLVIEATKEGEWIHFRVENSIPSIGIQNGGGIGLENLQRRLELLYPGRHHFCTEKHEDVFIADLKLANSV